MYRPKAYEPAQGYRFQILFYNERERAYEHIDYATDRLDRDFLLAEYRMDGNRYKAIQLPQKYWKK